MPEPAIEPIAIDAAAELETLRKVNAELMQKSASRKTKIAELESALTESHSKLSEAHDSLHQVTILGPLQAMAASISTTPELWLEQFSKTHKVAMVDGKLTIHSLDGKPMSVPFERKAIVDHLTAEAHPQSKTFKAITIVSRASGADSGRSQGAKREATPAHQFGFR